MSQNIYDTEAFFHGYDQLHRSQKGLAGAPEWASIRSLLPPLENKRVLDLGCGYGWFCRYAEERNATSVLGLDISGKMLERARQMTPETGVITYRRADLEQYSLPKQSIDLAYSSLALHYVSALDALLAGVHNTLAPGGCLVFSVEHPMFTAYERARWLCDDDNTRFWPVTRYQHEGTRVTDWIVKGVIKQHRTFATWMNSLLGAGFTLNRVEEWHPSDTQIADNPELEKERDRPMFLLMAATR